MSQNTTILNHLKENPITSFEAFNRYRITRLAARIKNLRDEGHEIITEIRNSDNARFAEYILLKGVN
tara:strand:+ start:31 stop:231 length:201 start_codon:yes stop_codon:yes gene_type:complete